MNLFKELYSTLLHLPPLRFHCAILITDKVLDMLWGSKFGDVVVRKLYSPPHKGSPTPRYKIIGLGQNFLYTVTANLPLNITTTCRRLKNAK